jgi:hypothetical protein
MQRYHVQKREDYHKYNKIAGQIKHLAHKLKLLSPDDPFRKRHEDLLLEKLYNMGILTAKTKLSDVEHKVTVSAFCRRRLPVVMCRMKMAETVPAVSRLETDCTAFLIASTGCKIRGARPCSCRSRGCFRSFIPRDTVITSGYELRLEQG